MPNSNQRWKVKTELEAEVATDTEKCRAVVANTVVVEEHLTKGPKDKFKLKSGGEINVVGGHFAVLQLQALLDKSPEDFRTLLAIARGNPQDAVPDSIERLKGGFLHPRTCEVHPPILRDILLSSYQETPEGPVLVNPFQLNQATDAQEVERQTKEGLNWLVREAFKTGPGGPKGK